MNRTPHGLAGLVCGFLLALSGAFLPGKAHAVSEEGYGATHFQVIVPFVATGEQFWFRTADGLDLRAIRFVHPQAKGTILIVPGQAEPWLKYGEVAYDFYQRGYSVYAYDHRGQGLSMHLGTGNTQIGHVDHFSEYVRDFADFVENVFVPENAGSNLYLLAHSMGGAIAADYLSRGPSPFRSVALSAPMFTINTDPFTRLQARLISGVASLIGFRKKYVPGRGDYEPDAPFEGNPYTGSAARFWMGYAVSAANPAVVIGGPSNGWVYQALKATPKIRRRSKKIQTPFLLFQAELDQIVEPEGQDKVCRSTAACTLVPVSGAQHEILMEKDAIRDSVLSRIENFFQ